MPKSIHTPRSSKAKAKKPKKPARPKHAPGHKGGSLTAAESKIQKGKHNDVL